MAEIQGGEEYNNYSNGEKVKTSDEFNIYHLPAGCWPPRLRSNTFSKIMTFGRGFGLIILAKMFACVWAESGPGPVWPSCADTATLQIQAHAFETTQHLAKFSTNIAAFAWLRISKS